MSVTSKAARGSSAAIKVIAILTLVMGISGGVVYAEDKITGDDVKADTLTGFHIVESSLRGLYGDNSRRLRFETTVETGTTQHEVLVLGAVRMLVECGSNGVARVLGGAPGAVVNFDLSSIQSHSAHNTAVPHIESGRLDIDPVLIEAGVASGESHKEVATIILTADGLAKPETTTVDVAFFVSRDAGSTYCYLSGTAIRRNDRRR